MTFYTYSFAIANLPSRSCSDELSCLREAAADKGGVAT